MRKSNEDFDRFYPLVSAERANQSEIFRDVGD